MQAQLSNYGADVNSRTICYLGCFSDFCRKGNGKDKGWLVSILECFKPGAKWRLCPCLLIFQASYLSLVSVQGPEGLTHSPDPDSPAAVLIIFTAALFWGSLCAFLFGFPTHVQVKKDQIFTFC